jgi:hypothetical protein
MRGVRTGLVVAIVGGLVAVGIGAVLVVRNTVDTHLHNAAQQAEASRRQADGELEGTVRTFAAAVAAVDVRTASDSTLRDIGARHGHVTVLHADRAATPPALQVLASGHYDTHGPYGGTVLACFTVAFPGTQGSREAPVVQRLPSCPAPGR